MKKNKESILKQYETLGAIMYNALLEGDSKAHNKATAKTIKLFKILENDKVLALECIEELLNNKNPALAIKGSAYCFALGENINFAEKKLEELEKNREISIWRLNAEMLLKEWKKRGEIKIYQK